MAEIVIDSYTKWQKLRPIPIPESKNCDPSERHPRTRHFLGVNPRLITVISIYNKHRKQEEAAVNRKISIQMESRLTQFE